MEAAGAAGSAGAAGAAGTAGAAGAAGAAHVSADQEAAFRRLFGLPERVAYPDPDPVSKTLSEMSETLTANRKQRRFSSPSGARHTWSDNRSAIRSDRSRGDPFGGDSLPTLFQSYHRGHGGAHGGAHGGVHGGHRPRRHSSLGMTVVTMRESSSTTVMPNDE